MSVEEIIRGNSNLIYKIATSFYNVEKEDLYQAGVLGLLKAYKNFKDNGETKFSSYAYDYIYGEMHTLVSNRNIKISKDILKLYRAIEKCRSALCQKLGHVPSNSEIASFLEMEESKIDEAIMAGNQIMSLDDDEMASLYDVIPSSNKSNIDDEILISESLEMLSKDEQDIIKARYYEDMTQSEVAKKLAMTQVMVSRYEKKGLAKMQAFMTMR